MGAAFAPTLANRELPISVAIRAGTESSVIHDLGEKGAFDESPERPVITEENKTAVRAGSTGNNVRYVLLGSLALAIIAWILVEYLVRP